MTIIGVLSDPSRKEQDESAASPLVCKVVVKVMVAMEIEGNQLDTWVDDAESAEGCRTVGTAMVVLVLSLFYRIL